MPRPKGARPDLRYKEKSIRPTSVTESVYLRFVSYAIGAGETIRDAMDAAMLAYMDGREVLAKDEFEEFAALGRLDDNDGQA